MSLQFQVVPITFGGGVDSKTDKKMSVPGKLTTLENGVFTKGQRISKRNGYSGLGQTIVGQGAATIGPSQALTSFNPSPGIDELVQVGGNKLYSYSESQDKWIPKDDCYSVELKYKSIFRNQADKLNGDVAINGGVELYAWGGITSGDPAGAVTIDSSTGAQIALIENLAPATGRPRVVSCGSFLIVFYVKPTGIVVCRRVDVTNPSVFSAEITVGNANPSKPALDVVSDGASYYVATYSSLNQIELQKFNAAGVFQATATIMVTVDTTLTLALGSSLFVFWASAATGLRYAAFSTALVQTLINTTIDPDTTNLIKMSSAIATGSDAKVFYHKGPDFDPLDRTNLAFSQQNIYRADCTTTAPAAPVLIQRGAWVATKPFFQAGVAYVWANQPSNLQSTLFLLRQDGLAIAKAYPGKARTAGAFNLPTVVARSATTFVHPQAVITEYTGELGLSVKSGIGSIALEFASPSAFQNKMLGRNLHFSGGYLAAYDGRSVTEAGFHLFPENISATTATTGGNLEDGVYQFAVVFEWIDNTGQIHRSAPSVALSVRLTGGGTTQKVTLKIPTLRITRKKGAAGECAIQIYRTLKDQTVFYNVKTSADPVLLNDTTIDLLTYGDVSTDSVIAANQLLYTTGGVLENIAPESSTAVDVYQNRMLLTGLEDPLEFAYSKVQVRGEGVAFSDIFTTRVDSLGGAITVGRLMDDKAILFKADHIFYVSGEGPNDTGAQNNYTSPALITADSGCPFPKSTVLMPLGIMYKSNKGIYLLNRGLQVEYVGADVEDYNGQDITAATLLQDKNQVRFLTSAGVTLVYDYYFKQWSTFTNHEGADALNWKKAYAYLRNSGQVYKQAATFRDAGTNQYLKPVTAWLKLAGIQGFQRVRRFGILAEYRSAHQLRIRVYYDYDDSQYDEYTFDAAAVIGSVTKPYQFRAHLRRQKCESIKFEIQDLSSGAAEESYSISDLSLEVGAKAGVARLKAANSI